MAHAIQRDVWFFSPLNEDIPIFGKINDIITLFGKCMFVSVPYIGSIFCKHYNAYEVYPNTSHYVICQQKEFADYHLLSLSKSFSHSLSHKLFVCLKYNITTMSL